MKEKEVAAGSSLHPFIIIITTVWFSEQLY
jgi:hypothetical protein